MAQRLRATVRSNDPVARLSDDAFAVLPDRVDAREFLEHVRLYVGNVLKQPLSALEDGAVALTDFGGTVGKAFSADDGTVADPLLKKADRRMDCYKFQDRSDDRGFPRRRESDPKG